ncbi:MAG TPA: ATP-dependent Clp protease ATP-binding subunit [Bacteroidia bacterium]|nr:ATP-dependent Clp protease ATP-binding subunit [Bacteroidia bacterium]
MADVINYSEDLKKAVRIAQSVAKEFSNPNFSAPHLLKALLHKDVGLQPLLESMDKDIYFLEEWAEVRLETFPKAGKITDDPAGDDKISTLMDEADTIRVKLSKDEIDATCALAALSIPGLGFSYDQLKTFPMTHQEIMSRLQENVSLKQAVSGAAAPGGTTGVAAGKISALLKYCIDKTELAREGKIDPIVGREKETRMVSEILGRRSKPNVIISGEPGVGKTALVDGFALSIINNLVPENFKSAKIFELDFGALVAGASYKGEVEDRLKNIVKELKQFEKAILFIDEIHALLDKNGGASGAANILKPELARGELTIIGATTNDEYRKIIESDEAFNRRFELLRIEEPDEKTCRKMLATIVPYYEEHHGIKLAPDAIPEAIKLAKRYIKERRLPDAAIDLIDRTMAVVKMTGATSKDEVEALHAGLEELLSKREELKPGELSVDLKWFYTQAKNRISHVLFSQLEEEKDIDKFDSDEALIAYIRSVLSRLKELAEVKKEIVDKGDIASVVAHKTGIPMGKLQSQEKEKLMNMENILKSRVVGQDHAVKAVAEAILESRSGLSKPGQPIGSFFLLGPTGTGKTELAKSLAEFMFMDENSLIRFDMSEFKEEHSAALLYGAPPGYVGYEEGGMLVNKIRQQPYAVVLFDEIEKAHNSVFDLFLQILDEGKLHDRLGKEGDFSNSVILFTSNIGSDFIVDKINKGQIPGTNEMMDIMGKYFRPEFLARLTEIVPFAPISENIVLNIFNIQMKSLLDPLTKQGITFTMSDKAREFLAKSGFTPKYGARPIKGVIRNQLRRPISKMIISGQVGKGDTITLDINDKNELLWAINGK